MRSGILNAALISNRGTAGCVARMFGALMLCVGFGAQGGAQTTPDASNMRVQILNGRTGRPLANQKIVVMGGDGVASHSAHKLGDEVTDGEGYAAIPNGNSPLPVVSVFVELHHACSKTDAHSFSIAKVRSSGVVSENSCRARITMYPQAGTLIFFVRDDTFLEKMRR